MSKEEKIAHIEQSLEETKTLLTNNTEKDATEFADWTNDKARIKYTRQIPNFPITTHFIYWCKLGVNIGSEQNKLRPVIIVRSQTKSPICTILLNIS